MDAPSADLQADTVALEAAKVTFEELLELVPSVYESVSFLDVRFMLEDPVLKEALEEEQPLAILGPAQGPIQQQADAVLAALGGSSVLGILRGTLDVETLIGQVNAPGFAVETESYEGFDIGRLEVDLGFISVDVAIAALDDATAIFAIAFSSESSSSDVVKGGLDTASGAEPGILSRPAVGTLANALPPGFAALLAVDCSLFFEEIGESIQGCAGFAMSVSREGPDGIVNGVLAFETADQALAAVASIEAQVAAGDDTDPDVLEPTEVTIDGNLIRLLTKVKVTAVLSRVSSLSVQ